MDPLCRNTLFSAAFALSSSFVLSALRVLALLRFSHFLIFSLPLAPILIHAYSVDFLRQHDGASGHVRGAQGREGEHEPQGDGFRLGLPRRTAGKFTSIMGLVYLGSRGGFRLAADDDLLVAPDVQQRC